jgi:hypothetical protein
MWVIVISTTDYQPAVHMHVDLCTTCSTLLLLMMMYTSYYYSGIQYIYLCKGVRTYIIWCRSIC